MPGEKKPNSDDDNVEVDIDSDDVPKTDETTHHHHTYRQIHDPTRTKDPPPQETPGQPPAPPEKTFYSDDYSEGVPPIPPLLHKDSFDQQAAKPVIEHDDTPISGEVDSEILPDTDHPFAKPSNEAAEQPDTVVVKGGENESLVLQTESSGGPVPEDEDRAPKMPSESEANFKTLEAMIQEGFAEILSQFEKKIRYDLAKEDHIRELHHEVQEYKSDLLSKTALPFVNGLIRLSDSIGDIVKTWQERGLSTLTPEKAITTIESFAKEIEILLTSNGYEPYSEPSEQFNDATQNPITREFTSNESLHNTIHQRLRQGYKKGDTIIRQEAVSIYVYSDLNQSNNSGSSIQPKSSE